MTVSVFKNILAAVILTLGVGLLSPLAHAQVSPKINLIAQVSGVGSGNTCLVPIPIYAYKNDLLLLTTFGGTSVAAPGFTAVPNGVSPVTSVGSSMSLLYRVATGFDGWLTTATTSSGGISCILQDWRGVSTVVPFDPASPQFAVGASMTASVSGITTTVDGDALVALTASTHNSDTGNWTPPSGFGNPLSLIVPGGALGGATMNQTVQGATGSISSAWNGPFNARWAMGLLA